jgi:hypothetical protein
LIFQGEIRIVIKRLGINKKKKSTGKINEKGYSDPEIGFEVNKKRIRFSDFLKKIENAVQN